MILVKKLIKNYPHFLRENWTNYIVDIQHYAYMRMLNLL